MQGSNLSSQGGGPIPSEQREVAAQAKASKQAAAAREAAIIAREAAMATRAATMAAREASMAKREAAMASREKLVISREEACSKLEAENAELRRVVGNEEAAVRTAVGLHRRTKEAVKVKKEQNVQMSQQVEELNERVEEANQCGVCMDRACNRVLIDCGHTFCEECIGSVAALAAARRTCPSCRKRFTKQQIRKLFL